MVVMPRLVWAHLPKAAGDTTLAMFNLFPEFVEFADPTGTHLKHAWFSERPEYTSGRERALNIRRLPAWILSFTLYKSKRGLHPHYTQLPMDSPRQMSLTSAADKHLAPFIETGSRLPEHWLRVETLAEDFLALMSRFTDVSPSRHRAVMALAPQNAILYERELGAWFTRKHIERMYDTNPLWATVEKTVHGDTLLDTWEDE
jgi:hypothetical protein